MAASSRFGTDRWVRHLAAEDLYAVLGVRHDTSHAEMRAAYLDVMRRNHPDVARGDAAADRARRANAAWAVLRDAHKRADYDRLRARVAGPPTPARMGSGRATVAYSRERAVVRQRFQLASLRVGVAVFLLGMIVLLAPR